MQPRVSVITPSLNQGEFLVDCIESVLKQGYANVEHIVIDGGSTDSTLEILRSFPHVRWISEPDRGQSDALNRGVRMSSGEIIAWLNSDDYYLPGAFAAVLPLLEKRSIVFGDCLCVDRLGTPTEVWRNFEHTWYDILKYWIPDSIPTQPSIFFTRAALEAAKPPDGEYFDLSLEYVMDFDLWLRMGRLFDFDQRIEQELACARQYGSNKTGGDWTPVFREAARVFARHSRAGCERSLAYVVPTSGLGGQTETLRAFLESVHQQTCTDVEVILVNRTDTRLVSSELRQLADHWASQFPSISVRAIGAEDASLFQAIEIGCREARSPIVCAVPTVSTVPPHLTLELLRSFADDSAGAILPAASYPEDFADPEQSDPTGTALKLVQGSHPVASVFAVRKAAFTDVGGMRLSSADEFSPGALLVRLLAGGWKLRRSPTLSRLSISDAQQNVVLSPSGAARIVLEIAEQLEHERFARLRAERGYGVQFPESIVGWARKLSSR